MKSKLIKTPKYYFGGFKKDLGNEDKGGLENLDQTSEDEEGYDELIKNIDNLRFLSIYGEVTEEEAKRVTTGLYAFHQQKRMIINRKDPEDYIEYCDPLELVISTPGRFIC